jgi:hypothetical protein
MLNEYLGTLTLFGFLCTGANALPVESPPGRLFPGKAGRS